MNLPMIEEVAITKSSHQLKMEKRGFCSFRYCEASHHFKYSVNLPVGKDWGDLEIVIQKFLVDNEVQEVQVIA